MKAIRIAAIIVLSLITFAMLGMALVIHNKTIVEWWIPTLVCALISLPAGAVISGSMRRIILFNHAIWNVIAGVIFSFTLLIGSFYSINYFMSDHFTVRERKVAVMGKSVEERYRVQRVTNRRVRKGEKYYVYYICVQWPDGHTKKIEITPSEYIRYKRGHKVTLLIEDGFFGLPVIKNMSFPIRKPQRRH